MSTTTTQANKTKRNAKSTAKGATTTARSAKTTARSASGTARKATGTARSAAKTASAGTRKATTTVRRESQVAERGFTVHGRRVVRAAQAEVSAIANQPTRPLFFALGVADRTAAGLRSAPGSFSSTLLESPRRTRERLVSVVATAGDLAERTQRGYGEVAEEGEKLVRSVRRQDSTQAAVKYAERAGTRASRAVSDVEKAVEAGTEAASQAVSKLG